MRERKTGRRKKKKVERKENGWEVGRKGYGKHLK